ncbi:XRE family transcriptional regulator [Flagellimonas onchidii]|uniref:XRE family transcriptional regulator n=1 Tax=Flagellimonas onchidii TaxID=2562684 RepID=UPI0010A66E65|nr:helix-turn-helix domain-containing protein [Allomuricauda onchidii]
MRTIKQLRKNMGISQTLLAEAVGVSLRTIQNYEQQGASIPSKNLSKIASYFDLSVTELYLQEENEPYTEKKTFIRNGCTFYPLDDTKHFVRVPLILIERQEKYIESLAESRLGNSPFKTAFVIDFLDEDPHKAFEVSGDSMNDGSIDAIPNKAIVLGIKIKKESFTKENNVMVGKPYVLVCTDRIICKKIIDFDTLKKTLRCQNLNTSPEYQDFDVAMEDVLEVFRIAKKQF